MTQADINFDFSSRLLEMEHSLLILVQFAKRAGMDLLFIKIGLSH